MQLLPWGVDPIPTMGRRDRFVCSLLWGVDPIPTMGRRNVQQLFDVEIFSDQPSLKLTKLGEYEADSRRIPALRQEAALCIQRWLARKQIWAQLRATPPNRQRAKELINDWFRKPNRGVQPLYHTVLHHCTNRTIAHYPTTHCSIAHCSTAHCPSSHCADYNEGHPNLVVNT